MDPAGRSLPFRAHPAPVIFVAFSPDGRRLVTASWDKTAKVWDATTGAESSPSAGTRHLVQCRRVQPGRQALATASWDKTAKVWDAATGKELFTLRGHEDRVDGVAFSPDGKYLATASQDNTVRVWDGGDRQGGPPLRGTHRLRPERGLQPRRRGWPSRLPRPSGK